MTKLHERKLAYYRSHMDRDDAALAAEMGRCSSSLEELRVAQDTLMEQLNALKEIIHIFQVQEQDPPSKDPL